MLLVDRSSTVGSLVFVDKDLDSQELGGTVVWSPPADVSQAASYDLYLCLNSAGGDPRTSIGSVPVGINQVSVSDNSPTTLYPYLAVYTKSTLLEQSTPAVIPAGGSVDANHTRTFVVYRNEIHRKRNCPYVGSAFV